MMEDSEDAMTHGVTVMECEPRFRRQYYVYLDNKRQEKVITESYFKSLVENYKLS